MIHPLSPLARSAPRLRVALTRSPRGTAPPLAGRQSPRRVRDQAREAMAVMAFSAFTSVALATALLIVSRLGQQG